MRFRDFCIRTDKQFFDSRPILLDVADKIEAWYFSDKKVLNLSMPTRMGKTRLSTLFCAWLFIHYPNKRILRSSYSADLAEQMSVQTKSVLLQFYESMPSIIPPTINGTRARWSIGNMSEPNMIGTGYEGTITGFGADIGIFDDMSKNIKTATSAAFDSDLNGFIQSVVYGRLENERKIMNVGTRWTQNDWFTKFNPDVEIILPALTDDGVSICEEWKTTAELLLEREKVSDVIWSAQYQQRPTVSGRVRLFETWKPAIVPRGTQAKTFITIDPSLMDGNDYFVMCYWGKERGQLFLKDIFAERKTTIETAVKWINSKSAGASFVEKNGYGKTILNRLINEFNVHNCVGFSTNSDKYTRAALQAENIENYLNIEEGCSHIDTLSNQMQAFPNGENDDLVDCLVMGFERWIYV